jgi:uncharacterized membrane protein
MEKKKETHKRSMTKSLLWRVIGVFVYAAIFYFFTKEWGITLAGTLIHHSTFLLVFYLHERFWIKLKRNNHWLKPFTYEIILGMGLGGLIVFALTGSWKAVSEITLTYTAVKLVLYFIYDRVWGKIQWGKE